MRAKRLVILIFVILVATQAYSASSVNKWVSLDSDSRSRIKKIIQSEVESREGFSTSQEEKINIKLVEQERQNELSAYKTAIDSANRDFIRTKKARDNASARFQTASYDFEELQKNIKTITTSIDNIDNQIARYEQDIKTQQAALKKWLQTEKQGEAIVAVIYTRGFKDKAHDLEALADQVSSPLMAQYMGTYIRSFSKVIDKVLTADFIQAIEEGSAKWNNEEPLRIELDKGNRGTTYLRLKRYELYPFQAPKQGRVRLGPEAKKMKVSLITSSKQLGSFLTQNKFTPGDYDLNRADFMIRETLHNDKQAGEGLKEQVGSFRERISALQEKIASARSDRDLQKSQVKKKELQYDKARLELGALRQKKDAAEKAFNDTQTALHDIKRTHESIIIKTNLATTRGSQTPAEASAEAIIDKLEEVRNDAKMQHSSSTTEVTNYQVTNESSAQAVTDARIIAVRLISFVNEGDSVRVKMAFRVKTSLEEKKTAKQDKGFFDGLFSSSSSEEPPPKPVEKKEPPPKPVAKYEPAPEIPKEAETKRPQPEPEKAAPVAVPHRTTKAIASAESNEFLFDIISAKMNGDELTLLVEATNNAKGTKYITLYDETSGRYQRSSLLDDYGKTREVNLVYLWHGDQKTAARDAYRGIPVEAGGKVTAQLIFKKMPPRTRGIKLLTLHPFTAIRIMFFKWRDEDLVFKNIPVRR
jgi:uncharacterized coiled-coil DUF342 family protein